MILLSLALVLNLALIAGMFWWMRRDREQLAILEARVTALSQAPAVPDEFLKLAAGSQSAVVIQILNPVELATNKHWAAGALSQVTPRLLRRMVHQQASKMISAELPKFGVVADVRVIDAS